MKTFAAVLVVSCLSLPLSSQVDMNSVGRVVQGQLGTLYDLRTKMVRGVAPAPKKESRGYAFHYSPSEVTKEFPRHKTIKKKTGEKSWAKTEALNSFNSFNTYESNGTTAGGKWGEPKTRDGSQTSPKKPSVDNGPFQLLGQGFNTVMSAIVTQKLIGLVDQEMPKSFLGPLKHLVSSGNRMVEFWDQQQNKRDGQKTGIMELMGYGLEELKKYRDGAPIEESDPVANLTSAAKTLLQGMVTVKKLTNRVVGNMGEDAMESRGGYGHESYGHGGGGYGHHVSYGSGSYGGLDPFSLLAALAFGAFLLQLLLTLLNTSARSLDVVDLNTPLALSDFHVPDTKFMNSLDRILGTPTVRNKRGAEEDSTFAAILEKLDRLYVGYKNVVEKPACAKVYMCRLAVEEDDDEGYLTKLYMFGLGAFVKDKSASEFVRSIRKRVEKGEDVNCDKVVKECPTSHKL